MGTPILSVLRSRAESCDTAERAPAEHRTEFLEAPENRNRASRGALTGILLGAGLWGVILVLAGIVKL